MPPIWRMRRIGGRPSLAPGTARAEPGESAMLRIAFAASALLAAGSAGAATLYDPQVAYTVVSGTSTNLMLANADGTRAVKVASYRGLLTGLDFAPGGGRIAYLDGQ